MDFTQGGPRLPSGVLVGMALRAAPALRFCLNSSQQCRQVAVQFLKEGYEDIDRDKFTVLNTAVCLYLELTGASS
jgi:hypothetical protein